MLEIRRAAPEDLGAIENLLSLCLLPHADLREGTCEFYVAESERGIIGVAGIEDCGAGNALARSIAVMPGFRKQRIARQLFQRLVCHAEARGLTELYLLTETASEYFVQIGFTPCERQKATPDLSASRLFRDQRSAGILMHRPLQGQVSRACLEQSTFAEVAAAARKHFDSGYYCAESVLLAVADWLGIKSPLIPAMATGFCNGVARTWGTCGALSGGVIALNLVYGRRSPGQPVDENYHAVRKLIDEFGTSCGSTLCSELLACDLDTKDGRRVYSDNQLRAQCREYVGLAARLAAALAEGKAGERSAHRAA